MIGTAGYLAARERAAAFDRSSRGKIAVAGGDRRAYLHAMLTNDVSSLQGGGGCYAAYLTPQGRLVADMVVLDLGDILLVDLDRSVTSAVLSKLDQFVFTEDVKLGDLSEAFGKLVVAGPAAAAVLAAVIEKGSGGPTKPCVGRAFRPAELASWPPFRNLRASFRGQVVVVAASDDLGVEAFDLYIERPFVDELSSALAAGGATTADPEDWETLRVEAGRPAFGADMDTTTIPLEAGIESRAISFTKGCFPGQEVVIRIVHRGHGRIARRLIGLTIEGPEVPATGDGLRSGDREAGKVTSAVWSPLVGGPVALAMAQRDFFEPGTELTVQHGDHALGARVVELPFRRA
jgi:tRNA-modifying protein YgfZ